jgi:hypothetical protein
MIAEVVHRMGRYFLAINGIYVAMETDVCRDPLTAEEQWSKESLDLAAAYINDMRWTSVADRFWSGGDEPGV